MRIVISEASGKSYQLELPKDKEMHIVGKKIGEELDGNLLGAAGYVLKLTGGSDSSGVPMKEEIAGAAKKFTLTSEGVGFKADHNGERRRRYARGNTYSAEIIQVNTQVKTAGASPLDQLFPKAEKKEKK
ncbi:30S ribosomal protein S6e [Candidatus Bilamarchaeum dharawalense]|uniref:Small ribosomal subunit protein eS6 n=1 Tax=Candidatus Bilamarchaeum dharawalense TaxID=2885759 RepID=A0A5E4LRQ1_9ARCH|nr:30S ribosomal protein S6e [Candidatus Bilamarchaeum dharawalense]